MQCLTGYYGKFCELYCTEQNYISENRKSVKTTLKEEKAILCRDLTVKNTSVYYTQLCKPDNYTYVVDCQPCMYNKKTKNCVLYTPQKNKVS